MNAESTASHEKRGQDSYKVSCDPVGCTVASDVVSLMVHTINGKIAVDPLYLDAEGAPYVPAAVSGRRNTLQITMVPDYFVRSGGSPIGGFHLGQPGPCVGAFTDTGAALISTDEFLSRLGRSQNVVAYDSRPVEDVVFSLKRELQTAPLISALQRAVSLQRSSPSTAEFHHPEGRWAPNSKHNACSRVQN